MAANSSFADDELLQFVTFVVAGETYGVPVGVVDEIIRMQPIAELPGVPSYIDGITNLRGSVVPVVNLRRRLGLPARETEADSIIMVVEFGDESVGLIVDGVQEVMHMSANSIEPPSAVIVSVNTDLIQGVGKHGNNLVIVLDLERALRRGAGGAGAALGSGDGKGRQKALPSGGMN